MKRKRSVLLKLMDASSILTTEVEQMLRQREYRRRTRRLAVPPTAQPKLVAKLVPPLSAPAGGD